MLLIAGRAVAQEALPPGDARDLVRGHCGACHALSLVTAQRGDADFWLRNIRWMQATQNLWDIPPAQEAMIVAYLARHFGDSNWGRRPNLPPELLPPPAQTE